MANATTQSNPVTEVKAFARGIHVPPRKARLVAQTMQQLPIVEALDQLRFLTKKAALPIRKLLDSAVANASHNFQIEADRLYVKSLTIDGGKVMFRYSPRAQGRAFPVRKRTSNINLILGVSATPFRKSRKTLTKTAVAETMPTDKEPQTATPLPTPETETTTSKLRFWQRKKKAEDTTQVPPKQDAKGKNYTSFDRRGNM